MTLPGAKDRKVRIIHAVGIVNPHINEEDQVILDYVRDGAKVYVRISAAEVRGHTWPLEDVVLRTAQGLAGFAKKIHTTAAVLANHVAAKARDIPPIDK